MLVGNSYGVMVNTGVAAKEPRRLVHLVYLDAYIPFEEENEIVLWSPDEQARVRTEIEGQQVSSATPNFTALVGITDPRMAEWVQERLTPHLISTYEDLPPSGSAESALIPRAFIHCTDGATAPFLEIFASRARSLGWKVHDFSAGHAAMLTHSRELADILLGLAND